MRPLQWLGWGLLAVGCVPHVHAQDRAHVDPTQIIGNRELPKVLYIVPWKKPLPGDLTGRPLASVMDEALAPVDRDVFRRQVRYEGILQTRAQAEVAVRVQAEQEAADRAAAAQAAPAPAPAPAPTVPPPAR